MKLSEALIQRADVQKRVQELRGRLNASVLVQEGEQPPENPEVLFAELDRAFAQLTALIGQINRTNLTATLPSGGAITGVVLADHVKNLDWQARRIVFEGKAPADTVTDVRERLRVLLGL